MIKKRIPVKENFADYEITNEFCEAYKVIYGEIHL